MSFQKLLRSFRESVSSARKDFTLEDEIALYRRRADVALREERFSDALVFLAKILRLNPYELTARMQVAEIYHHALGDRERALMSYEKIVATTGYDESNPYCVRAKDGIRELAAPETEPDPIEIEPLKRLLEEEIPQNENGALPQTVAG
jgi:tetratricopeptide (TPR) repeat protein